MVRNAIAWLRCEVQAVTAANDYGGDHDLFLARVTAVHEGRLKHPPLLYSSRLGWRITGEPAREKGVSVRDQLLDRVRATETDGGRA